MLCACGAPTKKDDMCKGCYWTWRRSQKAELKAKAQKLARSRPENRWAQAKVIAKKRKLSFDIPLEAYKTLVQQLCYYCAKPIAESGVALDRIDNTRGYELLNVLPACGKCNVLRSNKYTVAETYAMVQALKRYRD